MAEATSLRLTAGMDPSAEFENWTVPAWMTPRLVLASCVLLILSVSAYDTYLVYFFRGTILYDERNPICEALIRRDPQGLTWFFLGKATGNLIVISVLIGLYRFGYAYRSLVAIAVAMFQIGLTIYLCIADHANAVLCFDGLYSTNDRIARQAIQSLAIHLAILTGGSAALGLIYSTRETNPLAGKIMRYAKRVAIAIR